MAVRLGDLIKTAENPLQSVNRNFWSLCGDALEKIKRRFFAAFFILLIQSHFSGQSTFHYP